MSMPRLAVVLASAVCLVPSDETKKPADRAPRDAVAAVAGDYYFGDGYGTNCSLKVKPEGRFSFTCTGCFGLYDLNEGGACVEAGRLILSLEQPNDRKNPTEFHVVRWGERVYLIPDRDKEGFCDAVRRSNEPRSLAHGRFYLRRNDWEKKVDGLPRVPKDWEPLLRKKSPAKG